MADSGSPSGDATHGTNTVPASAGGAADPPDTARASASHDGSDGLAASLEPGPLRDELMGAAPSRAAPEPVATLGVLSRLEFTGDGGEYFRIWIVNLLLTLATLGVYSAWAKVRKVRYFWQNTKLEGHAFDFLGRPFAILLGRVVALALLFAYLFAFAVSLWTGVVMIALFCVAVPWLFMRAQCFRLGNTSWRGLRFGFAAGPGVAYRALLPPMLVWFAGLAVTHAVDKPGQDPTGVVGLFIPWMHHRLKAFQHGWATYGDRRFTFAPATGAFYATYFLAGVIALTAAIVAYAVLRIAMTLVGGVQAGTDTAASVHVIALVAGAVVAALVGHAYFTARMQRIVWSRTKLDDVHFATDIRSWPLAKLLAKNSVLTVLTLGFYWPFASVALARYRIECMRIASTAPLVALAARTRSTTVGATGDAAVDLFGPDIGL